MTKKSNEERMKERIDKQIEKGKIEYDPDAEKDEKTSITRDIPEDDDKDTTIIRE